VNVNVLKANAAEEAKLADLSKCDLIRLLAYLESELQVRDVALATLRSDTSKLLLYQVGRPCTIGLGLGIDPAAGQVRSPGHQRPLCRSAARLRRRLQLLARPRRLRPRLHRLHLRDAALPAGEAHLGSEARTCTSQAGTVRLKHAQIIAAQTPTSGKISYYILNWSSICHFMSVQ